MVLALGSAPLYACFLKASAAALKAFVLVLHIGCSAPGQFCYHVFSFLPISSRHGLSYDSSTLCITNLLRGDLHPDPNHLLLESKPVPFRNWIVVPGRLISKPPAWKSLIFKHTSLQSRRKLHASAFLLKSVELTKISTLTGEGFLCPFHYPKGHYGKSNHCRIVHQCDVSPQ